MGPGGLRACQDYLTQSCLKTGHLEQKSKIKFLCSIFGCYSETVQGHVCLRFNIKTVHLKGLRFQCNLYTEIVCAISVGELKGLFKL